ncbi:hypothetical protein FLX56_10090 [Synechococcus moorigangaii CMS01]|jgi:hypothetical protein|uniref:hypothetical protein n=1 Tax=Glycocaulis albus TaxID=1382801 RepID=UPI00166E60A8|nr:hypothetical protein [Glycocaulis albus]MBV5258769.1 hypothetical protein [Synechococcus moorigangaii CMS01]
MNAADFQPVIEALTSEAAIRVYVLVGIAVALFASGYSAFRSASSLRAFLATAPEFHVHGNVRKRATIEAKIKELEYLIEKRLHSSIKQIFLISTFAVVVPGAILVSMVCMSEFLFAGSPPPLEIDRSAAPGLKELIVFVADQALRGGLSDTFEVFDISVSSVTHNPDNVLFSLSLLAYRTLSGIAGAAIAFVALSFLFGGGAFKDLKSDLERRLEAA